MNAQQIKLVKRTFTQLELNGEAVAVLFYVRLFELDPSLRRLFHDDLHTQAQLFMAKLRIIVTALDKLETILPALQSLGQRHKYYGVNEFHYVTLRIALLWALQQDLGGLFTPEIEEAWNAAYQALATIMLQAAAKVAAPPMSMP